MSNALHPSPGGVRLRFLLVFVLLLFLIGGGTLQVWQHYHPVTTENLPPEQTAPGKGKPATPADPSLTVTLPGGYPFTGRRWLQEFRLPAGHYEGKEHFTASRDLLVDEEDRIWMMEFGNPAARLRLDRGSLERMIATAFRDPRAKLVGPVGVALDDPAIGHSIPGSDRGGSVEHPTEMDVKRPLGNWEQYCFYEVSGKAGLFRVVVKLGTQGRLSDLYYHFHSTDGQIITKGTGGRNLHGADGGIAIARLAQRENPEASQNWASFGLALPWLHGCPWDESDLDTNYGKLPLDRFLDGTEYPPNLGNLANLDPGLSYEEREKLRIAECIRLNFPETGDLPVFKEKHLWDQRWLADLPRPAWALKK